MVVEQEESEGWLRLRTIAARDYSPEEDLRHKLKVSERAHQCNCIRVSPCLICCR